MEPLSITFTTAFLLFELAPPRPKGESCLNIHYRRLMS